MALFGPEWDAKEARDIYKVHGAVLRILETKQWTVPTAMLDWTEDAFKARFGDAPRRTEVTVRLRHESKPDELFVRFSEHIDAESYAGYVRDMRRSGFARAWLVGKHVQEDSELHAQLTETGKKYRVFRESYILEAAEVFSPRADDSDDEVVFLGARTTEELARANLSEAKARGEIEDLTVMPKIPRKKRASDASAETDAKRPKPSAPPPAPKAPPPAPKAPAPAPSASSPAPPPIDLTKWACTSCTFLNEADDATCDVCDAARPAGEGDAARAPAAPAPRPARRAPKVAKKALAAAAAVKGEPAPEPADDERSTAVTADEERSSNASFRPRTATEALFGESDSEEEREFQFDEEKEGGESDSEEEFQFDDDDEGLECEPRRRNLECKPRRRDLECKPRELECKPKKRPRAESSDGECAPGCKPKSAPFEACAPGFEWVRMSDVRADLRCQLLVEEKWYDGRLLRPRGDPPRVVTFAYAGAWAGTSQDVDLPDELGCLRRPARTQSGPRPGRWASVD